MQVKGRMFRTSLDFISQKFGSAKLSCFINDNKEFSDVLSYSEIDWYPVEKIIELFEKLDSYFGYSDLSLMEEMGGYAARMAFDGSHRVFKDLKPRVLFSNAESIASSYYSSAKVHTEFIKNNCVKMYYCDFPESTHLSKRIFGWAKQGLTLCGGNNVHGSEFKIKDGYGFNFDWTE